MKSEYLSIFENRGKSYDLAMQKYPDARDQEFLNLFDNINLGDFKKVLDVPSGGGYLDKFFPEDTLIQCLEPCSEFGPKSPHLTNDTDLETLDLPEETYDLVVCLAAVHHVKNKKDFLQKCFNALVEDGVFCIGDVNIENSIIRFLDKFAGKYNGTGHSGQYLSIKELEQLAEDSGFTLIDCEDRPCPWIFDSEADMLDFCRLLFGLNVDDALLKSALEKEVGVYEVNGKTHLQWTLLYSTMKKAG